MNKNKRFLLVVITLIAIILYLLFIKKKKDVYSELINLDKKYETIDSLQKKGYIDLREIQNTQMSIVKEFINSFKINKKNILKVISKNKNDEIILTIYETGTNNKILAYQRPFNKPAIDFLAYSEIRINRNNKITEVLLKQTSYPSPMTDEEIKDLNWDLLYKYREE